MRAPPRPGQIPVGVIRVIVGIDDSLGGSTSEPLGETPDVPTLAGKRHRVDDDRSALGSKHSDISTDAVDHVDRVGHGFVIEKADPIVEVDRQQPHQCDQSRCDHADFATHVPPQRVHWKYTPQPVRRTADGALILERMKARSAIPLGITRRRKGRSKTSPARRGQQVPSPQSETEGFARQCAASGVRTQGVGFAEEPTLTEGNPEATERSWLESTRI